MTKTSHYGKDLTELFDEINEHWKKEQEKFSPTTEESAGDLSLPKDSLTTLCLFVVPRNILPYYQSNIFPTFIQYGFEPITYLDFVKFGENIIAKISSIVERVSMVIIDASSDKQYYQYELSLALEFNKKILIIKDESSNITISVAPERITIIQRPQDLYSLNNSDFFRRLNKYLIDNSVNIDLLYNEPIRLLNKREYRSAVISAFSSLESVLMKKLGENDMMITKAPFIRMIHYATKLKLISYDTEVELRDLYILRNRLVHGVGNVSEKNAKHVVNFVIKIISEIRSNKKSKTEMPTWEEDSSE